VACVPSGDHIHQSSTFMFLLSLPLVPPSTHPFSFFFFNPSVPPFAGTGRCLHFTCCTLFFFFPNYSPSFPLSFFVFFCVDFCCARISVFIDFLTHPSNYFLAVDMGSLLPYPYHLCATSLFLARRLLLAPRLPAPLPFLPASFFAYSIYFVFFWAVHFFYALVPLMRWPFSPWAFYLCWVGKEFPFTLLGPSQLRQLFTAWFFPHPLPRALSQCLDHCFLDLCCSPYPYLLVGDHLQGFSTPRPFLFLFIFGSLNAF